MPAAQVERLQCERDVGLGLVLEKRLVALLSKARGRVHDEFRVGAEWDFPVGKQIEGMCRFPVGVLAFRPHLKQNQIILAVEVDGHFLERFPINALVINANTTPLRFMFEHLIKQLRDARAGFAGASVAGDEPAATEILPGPVQSFELYDVPLRASPSHGKNSEAKKKAATAAKAGGFTLGRIVNYNEDFGNTPQPVVFANAAMGGAPKTAPTQLEPGSNQITVDVSLSYEIR